MEIHILRDGKQIGPYTEETVQSLLKQGNILINDLAWSPGLEGWSPLHAVLYPAAQPPPVPANAVPPPMPSAAGEAHPVAADPIPAAKPAAEEPATPRQKAFLTFLTVPFGPDLSKDRAALLVNDAMENPKNSGKLKRWDEERLRLYPDIFADEIKARRENRSQQYFEICQGEGAEYFDGVTKAHTQVLVGYLDVRYPTWDQTDHAAKYDYFFPAIAEKFPQLLKRTAKGRFKYPEGPKVAAELVRSPVAVHARARKSPLKAIVRGIFIGGILLGLGVGAFELKQRGGIDAIKAAITKASEQAKAASTKATASKPATAPEKPAVVASSTAPAAVRPPTTPPPGETAAPVTVAQAAPSAPPSLAPQPAPLAPNPAAPAANPGAPADPAAAVAAADPAMTPAPASPSGLPANVSLFDSTPPPAVPPPADTAIPPAASTPSPAVAPQRVFAKITKPTVITLRFGTSTLRPGTPVQVLSNSGTTLTIKFGPDTATVPVANTDFGSNEPLIPAPSGP